MGAFILIGGDTAPSSWANTQIRLPAIGRGIKGKSPLNAMDAPINGIQQPHGAKG